MHQVALLDVFEASQMDSSQASGFHQVCEDPLHNGGPLPDEPLPVAGLATPIDNPLSFFSPTRASKSFLHPLAFRLRGSAGTLFGSKHLRSMPSSPGQGIPSS